MMREDLLALWERQPGESAKAFAAFTAYRDLPAERRSVREAYAVSRGPKQGQNQVIRSAPGTWREWASKNAWAARAEAWDREQDRVARGELARRRARSRLSRIQAYEGALAMGLRALRDIEASGGAAAIGAAVAARLVMDAGDRLRTDLGDDPPQRVEISGVAEDADDAKIAALLVELGLMADVDPASLPPVGDRGDAEA
jgi:hypothetical protein